MKRIITALVSLAVLAGPVAADPVATWAKTENWSIDGTYDGFCRATATYNQNQEGMTLAVTKNAGWTMFFFSRKISLVTGEKYTMEIETDAGMRTRLYGVAISPNSVAFDAMNPKAILNLADASKVRMGDIGVYPLPGSKEAILQTVLCMKAMKGDPS